MIWRNRNSHHALHTGEDEEDPQNKRKGHSSSASSSGGGFSPSYCTMNCNRSYCINIIPNPPRFRRGEKGKAKCSEAAELYKGTSRERGFANTS